MKATNVNGWILGVIPVLVLLCFGCASANVNPPAPRANTGYVDFFIELAAGLAWDIQRFDSSATGFKPAFSSLNPIEGPVLRLAFAPGHLQLRMTFLNRFIGEPSVVEVDATFDL